MQKRAYKCSEHHRVLLIGNYRECKNDKIKRRLGITVLLIGNYRECKNLKLKNFRTIYLSELSSPILIVTFLLPTSRIENDTQSDHLTLLIIPYF